MESQQPANYTSDGPHFTREDNRLLHFDPEVHMQGAHCDLVAPSACCEEGPGVLPRHFESGRGIYGLITAVIINGKMDAANYSAYSGPLDPGYSWRIIQQRKNMGFTGISPGWWGE